MDGVGEKSDHVEKLLGVSDMLAFKILKLNRWARALAVALTVLGLALLTALVIVVVQAAKLVSHNWPLAGAVVEAVRDTAASAVGLFTSWPGSAGKFVAVAAAIIVVALVGVFFFGGKKHRGEALVRVLLSFAGVLTSVIAWVHLLIFDRWFLKAGSIERYSALGREPAESPGDGRTRVTLPAPPPTTGMPPPRPDPHALNEPRALGAAPAIGIGGGAAPVTATVEAPGGNGRASESDSNGKQSSAADLEDPDARQD